MNSAAKKSCVRNLGAEVKVVVRSWLSRRAKASGTHPYRAAAQSPDNEQGLTPTRTPHFVLVKEKFLFPFHARAADPASHAPTVSRHAALPQLKRLDLGKPRRLKIEDCEEL